MASNCQPHLITVRDLRRRWKPHKERLAAQRPQHPTQIRFHRACSWLQRVEAMQEDDADLALLGLWIAFNSLYGQWDAEKRLAVLDRDCWPVFIERILELDAAGYLAETLKQDKWLVLSLLKDEYLSNPFWRNPCQRQAEQVRQAKIKAQEWYRYAQWQTILREVLERIYLLRCQLIHGASTFQSDLNRKAVLQCALMMRHLLVAILLVWIDFGADEDWGILCYPPRPGKAGVATT